MKGTLITIVKRQAFEEPGMASSVERTVCVTGASGFIGSWIVRFLLQRGYRVRGTVQNLGDEAKTQHLRSMEGADIRLELFEADLHKYESLAIAIGKTEGVFHVASPCFLQPTQDPQKELIDPAIQGTLNVLKASHAAGVRRVVVTSSLAAVFPNPHLSPGAVVDENSWTDIEYCKEQGGWYRISKTLAELAAWKFAEETGLDVVVVNPGYVLGPLLQPRLNASSGFLVDLIQGVGNSHKHGWMGFVHVQDVAQAHILVYETLDAKGRYLCTNAPIHVSDLAEEVVHMYPQLNVYRFKKEIDPGPLTFSCGKLMSLGFTFTSREKLIRDAVLSLQDKGYLPK